MRVIRGRRRADQGMNRLRHAYVELTPDLAPYLVAGWHDDEAGVLTTLGV